MSDNVGIRFTGDESDLKRALGASGAGVEQFGRKATADLQRMGQAGEKSAKEISFAMRGLPAQFTDIATSLQAGQRPLTVLLQQGGQLKDMFGGIGPAARAMGGYVVGLVNPFTLAAAAAAALGYAYYEGSQEGTAFTKAVVMSGTAAGVTAGQLKQMAERIDAVTGTHSAAAAALAEFAANGNIAGDQIERFTTIALLMEKETGQAVKKTVEQFNDLGLSPVEASAKLNESTHYLTLSIWQQIKALDEQGRMAEAGALAQKAYADALEQRLQQVNNSLGYIERAWRGITGAAKEGWDAMLGVGRGQSMQDKLLEAQTQLQERQKRGPLNDSVGSASFEKGNQALRDRIAFLSESIRVENRSAEASKNTADQVKARVSFDKEGDQFLSKREKMERDVTEARIKGNAAGATQAEIEQRVGQIREKYKDKGGINAGLQADKAQVTADVAAIKKANEELVGNYSNAEKIIEAMRGAGMLTDKEYYQSKIGFLNLETDAKAEALRKEIARYQEEDLIGKDRIDNERKIANAQAALVILQANATAKREVLAIQEGAAVKRLQLAYLSARQAAQDYFATSERKQARDLADVGAGTQKREFNAGISQIEDRYGDQRRDLENEKARLDLEGKFTDDARAQYEARLSIINEFQAKSIESYTQYYEKLIEKQGDWALGASEGLKNYLADARNVFKQTEDLVNNAFKGMEDALVNFVKTGKLDFKSLADSIVTDIIRMQVRAAISGAMGGGTGTGGGGGFGFDLGKIFAPGMGLFNGLFNSAGSGLGGIGNMGADSLIPGFDGGGSTGTGPRSGGLDGKGGFMAMLHPQETVLDHTKGQNQQKAGDTNNTYYFGDGVKRSDVLAAMQVVRGQASSDRYQASQRARIV